MEVALGEVAERHINLIVIRMLDLHINSIHVLICMVPREKVWFLTKSKLLLLWIYSINPLNAELNPICYLLALLGAHHFLHVSRMRVKVPLTSRFCSCVSGGFFCTEFVRAHRGVDFTLLHFHLYFKCWSDIKLSAYGVSLNLRWMRQQCTIWCKLLQLNVFINEFLPSI